MSVSEVVNVKAFPELFGDRVDKVWHSLKLITNLNTLEEGMEG